MTDIGEIVILQENLGWLKTQFKRASLNWQQSRPDCRYYGGVVKEICQKPGKLEPMIFDPLQKWLADYILSREGKIAFSGTNGLDFFIKSGLRTIYYFTEIADFFSKNPQYLAPIPSPITQANLAQAQQSTKMQKTYSDFINTFSSKLIGCNKQLSFLFLDLSKTVKYLPEDLINMQNNLEQKCTSYRISQLR
jgi:hypothetical protein